MTSWRDPGDRDGIAPYTVSLEPDCLGCYGGFVLNEPFPVDMAAHPGECP